MLSTRPVRSNASRNVSSPHSALRASRSTRDSSSGRFRATFFSGRVASRSSASLARAAAPRSPLRASPARPARDALEPAAAAARPAVISLKLFSDSPRFTSKKGSEAIRGVENGVRDEAGGECEVVGGRVRKTIGCGEKGGAHRACKVGQGRCVRRCAGPALVNIPLPTPSRHFLCKVPSGIPLPPLTPPPCPFMCCCCRSRTPHTLAPGRQRGCRSSRCPSSRRRRRPRWIRPTFQTECVAQDRHGAALPPRLETAGGARVGLSLRGDSAVSRCPHASCGQPERTQFGIDAQSSGDADMRIREFLIESK
eukprot:scaffold2188_cov102-Isochrysis_galbana.AAC.16